MLRLSLALSHTHTQTHARKHTHTQNHVVRKHIRSKGDPDLSAHWITPQTQICPSHCSYFPPIVPTCIPEGAHVKVLLS